MLELFIIDDKYALATQTKKNKIETLLFFESKAAWEDFICEFNIVREDYWKSIKEESR